MGGYDVDGTQGPHLIGRGEQGWALEEERQEGTGSGHKISVYYRPLLSKQVNPAFCLSLSFN